MLFALVNGEKFEAMPKTEGKCPLCNEIFYSKCGDINIWHWAHYKDNSCDSWYEPESEWHRNWKMVFGRNNSEIIISRDEARHIADIQTRENVIIELQNSPIPRPTIYQRESFYGERMIWIVNGKHFKHNFRVQQSFPGSYSRNEKNYEDRHGIFTKNTEGLAPHSKDDFRFIWDWPRKSWSGVQRNVFVDCGAENLFWSLDGMGTKNGRGRKTSKEKFIKKYGGNLELLTTLIDKSNI